MTRACRWALVESGPRVRRSYCPAPPGEPPPGPLRGGSHVERLRRPPGDPTGPTPWRFRGERSWGEALRGASQVESLRRTLRGTTPWRFRQGRSWGETLREGPLRGLLRAASAPGRDPAWT